MNYFRVYVVVASAIFVLSDLGGLAVALPS